MKVSIKQLEFPSSIKDKILKLKDISKLHIDFIGGKYIHFENTNLSIHKPHQIIISNDNSYFALINYENNPTLYDKSTMQNATIDTIKFLKFPQALINTEQNGYKFLCNFRLPSA